VPAPVRGAGPQHRGRPGAAGTAGAPLPEQALGAVLPGAAGGGTGAADTAGTLLSGAAAPGSAGGTRAPASPGIQAGGTAAAGRPPYRPCGATGLGRRTASGLPAGHGG